MTTDIQLKNHVNEIVKLIETGIDWEGEETTAFDYLEDMLDVNWILDSEKNYKSARICVAFGGPTIWIDLEKKEVQGYWWNETYIQRYFKDEMDLDYHMNEIFYS